MDVGFVVPVADEGHVQLEQCLGALRAAYPEAPVVVVADGVVEPRYADACRGHRAGYVQGSYLKRLECGGLWWRRLLEEGLKLGTRWICKLDADARFWRPLAVEPPEPIAGTLENAGTDLENLQGGCQLVRADAARRITQSNLPEHGALRNEWTFAENDAIRREWRARSYVSSDRQLLWFARQLGIAYGDYAEVASRWLPPAPENRDLRAAVTHPHKLAPAPRFLDSPLRVITTCKGRLAHLKQALPSWTAEPAVAVTVVDYDCPEGTADWVRANFPRVRVVKVTAAPRFNLAHARNLGAAHSPPGWWCFFDADLVCRSGWAADVRRALRRRSYLLLSPIEWGQFGSVVVHADDFQAAGGYDPLFRGWGAEDGDFYARLRHTGVRPGAVPARQFTTLGHSDADRTRHYATRDKFASQRVYEVYFAKKIEFLRTVGRLPSRDECRDLLLLVLVELKIASDSPFYPAPLEIDVVVAVLEGAPGRPPGLPAPRPPALPPPRRPPAAPARGETPEPSPPPVEAPTSTSTVIDVAPRAVVEPANPPVSVPVPADARLEMPRPVSEPAGTAAMINISLVNHATVPLGLALQDLAKLCNDYGKQVIVPHWPGKDCSVVASAQVLPHTWAIILMDDADQQGALGYHDVTPDGMPLAKVFVRTSLADGATVTEVTTHELAEMLVDPDCNLQAADPNGNLVAYEVGDPVESSLFLLDGHKVSNIVTPAWFEPYHAPGSMRFDHLGEITKPFELAKGGYAVVTDPQSGQTQEIFGSVEKKFLFAKEDRRMHRSEVRKARAAYARGHAAPQYIARLGRRPILTHA